jgi:hypothetical protein
MEVPLRTTLAPTAPVAEGAGVAAAGAAGRARRLGKTLGEESP